MKVNIHITGGLLLFQYKPNLCCSTASVTYREMGTLEFEPSCSCLLNGLFHVGFRWSAKVIAVGSWADINPEKNTGRSQGSALSTGSRYAESPQSTDCSLQRALNESQVNTFPFNQHQEERRLSWPTIVTLATAQSRSAAGSLRPWRRGKGDLLCARLVYEAITDVSRVELRLRLILAQPLVTFLGNCVFPLNSAFTMTR